MADNGDRAAQIGQRGGHSRNGDAGALGINANGDGVVTIQKTAKAIKGIIAAGGILFWGGLAGAVLGFTGGASTAHAVTGGLGLACIVIGAVLYLIGKGVAWWRHG